MAIATATRTTYDNVLRHVYTPDLWELQNRDRILLQLIGRKSAMYAEGKQINIRLHTAGAGAVGYSSSGTLPTSGTQKFNEVSTGYKRLYGTFKIDGALLKSAREPSAAELDSLLSEARGCVEDQADALAYDIHQDGSGRLGGVLSNPNGGASTSSFRIPKINNGLKANMIIDVTTVAGAVTEGKVGLLVTSVVTDGTDATLDLVTLHADGGVLAGTGDVGGGTYYAYRQGSRNDSIYGLDGIVDTTSPEAGHTGAGHYLGVNRATAGNEYWRAQVLANGGTNREITLDLLQELRDAIEMNSPGTPKLGICSHAIWRRIAQILVPDKRYGGDLYKLNGWCQAVDFAGMPIVRDKWARRNELYMLDLDVWSIYQDSEGGWVDEDGQILHRVSGADQFEAAWRRFLEIVCHDPASNGVLKDLSE